jgi:hypothetical protein
VYTKFQKELGKPTEGLRELDKELAKKTGGKAGPLGPDIAKEAEKPPQVASPTPSPPGKTDSPAVASPPTAVSDGVPIWLWLALIIGAVMVVVVPVMSRKRAKNKKLSGAKRPGIGRR